MAGHGNPQNLTNAGKGRKKGSVNKTTKLAKEAIAEAFDELGGKDGLVKWAKTDTENLKVFYATIWPKIIPIQTELTGKDGGAIQMEKVQNDADAFTSAIVGLAARGAAGSGTSQTEH